MKPLEIQKMAALLLETNTELGATRLLRAILEKEKVELPLKKAHDAVGSVNATNKNNDEYCRMFDASF